MAKLIMRVELEYDESVIHGGDQTAIDWFHKDILMNAGENSGLVLFSNEIGDEVGKINVIEIEK